MAMSLQSFAVIFLSVLLSALAQLSFKHGVSHVTLAADASLLVKALLLFASPFVFLGLALYGVGTVLWLFALKQMDLSLAYPFVGMSFIMVFFFSVWLLGEPFSLNRLIGTVIIIVGLLFLARA
ncbi:MAG: EamA family transporter [Cellvibrionaceae bacterium]|nr:EamA family transporter [Cellvibrionaceae bacterium]